MREYQGDYEPSYSLHLSQRAMALVRSTVIFCLTALVIAGSILFYTYSSERFNIIASDQGVYIFDRKEVFLSHCTSDGKCTTVTQKKPVTAPLGIQQMPAATPASRGLSSFFSGLTGGMGQAPSMQTQPFAQQAAPQEGAISQSAALGAGAVNSNGLNAIQQNRPASSLQSSILGQNPESPSVVQNQLSDAQHQLNAQEQQAHFQQTATNGSFDGINETSGGTATNADIGAPQANSVGFQPVTPPQFQPTSAPQWDPVNAEPGTGVLGTNISHDTSDPMNSFGENPPSNDNNPINGDGAANNAADQGNLDGFNNATDGSGYQGSYGNA